MAPFELEHPVAWKTHHYAWSMERKDAMIMDSLMVDGWLESILGRIAIGERGCLDWVGALDSGEYPEVHLPARVHRNATAKVHRSLWLSANGPIPFGMVVDHRCWNRLCCELGHMRVCTQAENIANRGPSRKQPSAPDPDQYALFEMMPA